MRYLQGFLAILSIFFGLPALAAEISHAPFFLIGDGEVHIVSKNTGASVRAHYLNDDGTLNDAVFARIDAVFEFPTQEMGENISRRTIAMLDYFSDLIAPGKAITLVSGYRNKAANDALRAAGRTAGKTSTHIDGMAIDFSLPGVNGKKLWDRIRHKDCCGVGNYGGNVVHLDSGRPRFWEQATAKVNTGASDFNRTIYLSTEYDRYHAGDRVRLLFTQASDFGFGVKRRFGYVRDKQGLKVIRQGKLTGSGRRQGECLMIETRQQARFLYIDLPADGFSGRVRVRLDFCNRPFTEMPQQTVSNEIEID